jgi:nucleotide-binding universal stress UspA family protein
VRTQIDVRRGSPLGNPVEAILACARDNAADLIAMTTQGKGGLTEVVLGSVAREVLHRAPIPVFLFRHHAPAP